MATTVLRPAATYRTGLYEWLTTTDHKLIGIMYVVACFIFFAVAGPTCLRYDLSSNSASITSASPPGP